MRTMIERLELAGRSSSDVGRWIDGWRDLHRHGWEVTVLTVEQPPTGRRKLRVTTHLIGLASHPGHFVPGDPGASSGVD
jgi:hypothetical protein